MNDTNKRIPWNKDKPWSDEMKKKISESCKGRKSWNKGQKLGEEHRKKISESMKGKVPWNKGKPWSQEIKDLISKSRLITRREMENEKTIKE